MPLNDEEKKVLGQRGYKPVTNLRELLTIEDFISAPLTGHYGIQGRLDYYVLNRLEYIEPEHIPIIDVEHHKDEFKLQLDLDKVLYQTMLEGIQKRKIEPLKKIHVKDHLNGR